MQKVITNEQVQMAFPILVHTFSSKGSSLTHLTTSDPESSPESAKVRAHGEDSLKHLLWRRQRLSAPMARREPGPSPNGCVTREESQNGSLSQRGRKESVLPFKERSIKRDKEEGVDVKTDHVSWSLENCTGALQPPMRRASGIS